MFSTHAEEGTLGVPMVTSSSPRSHLVAPGGPPVADLRQVVEAQALALVGLTQRVKMLEEAYISLERRSFRYRWAVLTQWFVDRWRGTRARLQS